MRHLLLALHTASIIVPAVSLSTTAQAQNLSSDAESDASVFELPTQAVIASEAERAGPIDGYVATRTQTGSKTDTPVLQIPQSISVITADRIRDQGALTLQDTLRYTAGVRGEAYGLDSRGDFATVRGASPALFLDGLQQSFGSYTNTRTDPFTLSESKC
jgi:iron complex outermembrane receptor protein